VSGVSHVRVGSRAGAGRRGVCVAAAVALLAVLASGMSSGTAHAAGGPGTCPFGIESFNSVFLDKDGAIDTQAGSHPAEAVFTIHFNTIEGHTRGGLCKEVREVVTELPPGLVADPNVTPHCSRAALDTGVFAPYCPPDTQVGTVKILPSGFTFPLYNLVPPSNAPAELGLFVLGVKTFFNTSVRTDSDYGIDVRIPNIPQGRGIAGSIVTVWGFPAEASHTPERPCLGAGAESECPSDAPLRPFFTMPTACGGPLTTTGMITPWQGEGEPAESAELSFLTESEGVPFGYTGCEHLRFTPSIAIVPSSADAETPSGVSVDLKEPQEGLSDPDGVSQSDIKTTTVTLPEGVAVNPGAAAGLGACQLSEDGIGTTGPPSCPTDSKLGTTTIRTPLLEDPVDGNVYVLQSNPPHLQLLLAAYAEGTWIKLKGEVSLNETTGQATVTFPDTPQFPLSSVEMEFGGGPQAALVTPPTCGEYGTESDFTPWSTPFVNDATATDDFAITTGADGRPCVSRQSELPFSPTMTAGTTTDQAGGFTGFSMLLQREDGQQRIASLQFKTPEGMLGMISRVGLCEEPRAATGDCPADSQIGHTVVGAGAGSFPLFVPETGRPPAPIYLTGPYEGAPYGLAIVVPVVVGPFDLGQIVVRAKIEVDPHTSRLTITTNPTTLPTILDGVPADVRDINVVLDRPEFIFNPTSCAPMAFTGTAYSTEGAAAPLSSHFQVGSCRSLKFNPNFQVSTQARTSRADGASLTASILYPTGALGANQASSQSNIAQVKVELPKQLPARLTTLQKACLAATFDANPAECPSDSVVGHVKVLTPVLGIPLTGPAYFVSHGGEAFPSLVVVLQGAGVTIDLAGTTFISEAGITSSTFKAVPDVPINLFELTLPEGPYSALAAHGNLCKTSLKMPTDFVAQNGAVIERDTKLQVTGCPKTKETKKATAKRRHTRRHPHRGRKRS
jgi:hypothetical protein